MPEPDLPCAESPAYWTACAVVQSLPLFAYPEYLRIMLDGLAQLRGHKGTRLCAFVVLPAEVHAVLWPARGVPISEVIRELKWHSSHRIARQAQRLAHRQYLAAFASAASRPRQLWKYQVWQEGSQPEALSSQQSARQKIESIHASPVRAGLAAKPEEYPYSSARAYLLGQPTHPPVDLLRLG
ncbi:MAG: transposase [Thermoguttaceae bacterium]